MSFRFVLAACCLCYRPMWSMTTVLVLTAVLTGCFPVPHTFYKPHVPDESKPIVDEASVGGCAAPHVLTFFRQGIGFTLKTSYQQENAVTRGGLLAAYFFFLIPPRTVMKFDVQALRAVNNSGKRIGGKPLEVAIRNWKPSKMVKLKPPPTKFSAAGHISPYDKRAWYSVLWNIRLTNPTPKMFFIIVPKMTINSRHYPPLKVKFKKTSEINLVPINGC